MKQDSTLGEWADMFDGMAKVVSKMIEDGCALKTRIEDFSDFIRDSEDFYSSNDFKDFIKNIDDFS